MRVSNKRGGHLESTPEGSEYSDGELHVESLQTGHRQSRRRSSSIENYRQEGLLRRLREAQGFIEEVVAEKELLLELLQTERALHYWRLGVIVVRGNRHFKIRTWGHVLRRQLAAAFENWFQSVQRRRRLKFSVSQLLLVRENFHLKCTVCAWTRYVRRARRTSAILGSVDQRRATSCQRLAFERWYQGWQEVVQATLSLSKHTNQREHSNLAAALCNWNSVCKKQRKSKRLLFLIQSRVRKRSTIEIFSTWFGTVRVNRKVRTCLGNVISSIRNRVLGRGLSAWFDLCCTNRKYRHFTVTLADKGRNGVLSRTLLAWSRVCVEQRSMFGAANRQEGRGRTRVLATCLSEWMRVAAQRGRVSVTLTRRHKVRQRAALAEAMTAWQEERTQGRRLKHCARVVGAKASVAAVELSLVGWYELVEAEREGRHAEEAGRRRAEGRAEESLRRERVAMLRGWCEEAQLLKRRSEGAEHVRRRGETCRLRVTVSAWRTVQDQHRRERLEMQRLQSRWQLQRALQRFAEWQLAGSDKRRRVWADTVAAGRARGREGRLVAECWGGWAGVREWGARLGRVVGWVERREEGRAKAWAAGQWQAGVYEELKAAAIVERSHFLHSLPALAKPFLLLWAATNEAAQHQVRAGRFRYKVVCGAALRGWYGRFWWRRQAQVVAGRFARRAEHWAERRVRAMLGQWGALVQQMQLLRHNQARASLLLWTNTKRAYYGRWARAARLAGEAARRGREAVQGRALRGWHDSLGSERGQRILNLIAEASLSINPADGLHALDADGADFVVDEDDEDEEGGGGAEEGGSGWEEEEDPRARLRAALGEFAVLSSQGEDGTETEEVWSSGEVSGAVSQSSADERRA